MIMKPLGKTSTQSSPSDTDVLALNMAYGEPPHVAVTANFASAPAASPAPCVSAMDISPQNRAYFTLFLVFPSSVGGEF